MGLIPSLRVFARFLVRDIAAAEDLLQDTIVQVLAKSHQYQAQTSLNAWTCAIMRHLFLEQIRRKKKERQIITSYTDDVAPVQASYNNGPQRQTVRDLNEMLWQISPLLREALILVAVQELSYEEAALICETSPGTVRTRVSRARAELMQLKKKASE